MKIKKKRTPPAAARAATIRAEAAAAETESAETEPAEAPAAAKSRGGQYQDVDDVIVPDMMAYAFWKEWWRARDRGDFPFLFQLSAEGSALREHFGPTDVFAEVCRRKMRRVRGMEQGNLIRMRFHADDEVYFFQAIDLRARERRDYDLERWFVVRGEQGWRVHAIDVITVPKERPPTELGLDDFPPTALPEWLPALRARRAAETEADAEPDTIAESSD